MSKLYKMLESFPERSKKISSLVPKIKKSLEIRKFILKNYQNIWKKLEKIKKIWRYFEEFFNNN
jgi:hypothetical protein